MCFISGQLSVNVKGEYLAGTIKEEVIQAFDNVFVAAKAAGFDKSEIVYIEIEFSNLTEIKDAHDIYMDLFPEGRRPARTIYQAAALPFGGKIKIVATTVKSIKNG